MTGLGELGRGLMVLGAVLLGLGIALTLVGRLSGLPSLPGDILIRRPGFTFYLPLTTCLLASLLLTLAFRIWRR